MLFDFGFLKRILRNDSNSFCRLLQTNVEAFS